MVEYEGKTLLINGKIFDECMKLDPAPEKIVDRVYITEKKRLAKLLQPGDRYEDMIWLLCERIMR